MQSPDAARKNILLTPLEKSTVDSILLDIGNEPKQVIKVYAHDNPQTYWSIPVTASHSAGDVCRIIAHKTGSDYKYQLSEECSGREVFLEGTELIFEVLSKRRKHKKYQFIIRPNTKAPSSPALDRKSPTPSTEEATFVRVYYHLNPSTYWSIPTSVTLTFGDVCAHIAAKLQLPDKESCYIYLVDDSRIHAGQAVAPTLVTHDQNVKGLLVQYRTAPVRLVVAFKQLAEGAIIPPLPKESTDGPRKASFSSSSSPSASPTPNLSTPSPHPPITSTVPWNESPPSAHYIRLFDTKAKTPPTNIPVYSLPPTTTTSSPPVSNSISTITAPSFTFTLSPTKNASPSGKREISRDPQPQQQSPSNENSPKIEHASFLDQLRHDLKEENKALDRRQKLYDESWLDIPGYDPKPPSPLPEQSHSPGPNGPSTSPNHSPSPKRRLFGGSRSSTPSRFSREGSPILIREGEMGEYGGETVHPIDLSSNTLKESLTNVSQLDELSREQYREEVLDYERKLKEGLASVNLK